jgi:integrase
MYGDIVRLLLLTGQRRQEIAGFQRSEIILDEEPRIVMPAERTKNGKQHTVPLAPQAIAILKPYLAADNESAHIASIAIFNWASFSFAKAALDREFGIEFRLHDLRRTCATGMAEWLGVAPHIIEAVLNHSKPSVAGIYNRATYQREMREALTRWADFVTLLG